MTSDVWFQLVVLCNYGDYVANLSETYIATACLNVSLLQRISLYLWYSLGGKTHIKSIISVTCQQPCSDICLITWLTRKIFLLGLNNSEKIFYNVSFDVYQLKDQSCFVLCLTSSLVKSQHNKTKAFVIFTYLEQTALKHHIEKKQYAPVQPAACITIVLWEGKVLHWLMSLPYFTCIFLTFVFKMLWFANTAPLYTFHNSLL